MSTTTNLIADNLSNQEPTVITAKVGSTVHTVIVDQKVTSTDTHYTLHAYHTTGTSTTFSSPVQLPLAGTGFPTTGDPYLAADTVSTSTYYGRIYCSGIMVMDKPNPSQPWINGDTAVAVWSSDDGGVTWSDPTIVDYVTGNSVAANDKPMITVGPQGDVYVTWVYVTQYYDANGVLQNVNGNTVRVALSSDGGASFWRSYTSFTGNYHFPTIVANPSNGYLSLFFVKLGAEIRTATSTNQAVSFGTDTLVTNLHVLGKNGAGTSQVPRNTIPMARYNAAASRISLVYTGSVTGGASSTTDVYYLHNACTSNCTNGWVQPIRFAKTSTGGTPSYSRFMPGMDYVKSGTRAGNVIIGYYDTRDSTGDTDYYKEYYSELTADGASISGVNDVAASSALTAQNVGIGDYQDLFWFQDSSVGTLISSGWIGQLSPYTARKPYLTRLQ